MTDPQRLLDAPPDPAVSDLLGSAEHDVASPEAVSRTAHALGIAGLVSTGAAGTVSLSSATATAATSQAGASGAALAGKTATGLGAKWIIVGALAAIGSVGAVLATQAGSDDESSSTVAPAARHSAPIDEVVIGDENNGATEIAALGLAHEPPPAVSPKPEPAVSAEHAAAEPAITPTARGPVPPTGTGANRATAGP